MFFSWQQSPWCYWGWEGAPFFSFVSCSVVLLWMHEDFPNKALENITCFAIKAYVTSLNVELWDVVKWGS